MTGVVRTDMTPDSNGVMSEKKKCRFAIVQFVDRSTSDRAL